MQCKAAEPREDEEQDSHAPDVCDKPQVSAPGGDVQLLISAETKCPQIDEFGLSSERIRKIHSGKAEKKKVIAIKRKLQLKW